MKAYGLIEHVGLKAAPLHRKYWDNGDGVNMGHGRRSKNDVRQQMKKSARNAAKRELKNENVTE